MIAFGNKEFAQRSFNRNLRICMAHLHSTNKDDDSFSKEKNAQHWVFEKVVIKKE